MFRQGRASTIPMREDELLETLGRFIPLFSGGFMIVETERIVKLKLFQKQFLALSIPRDVGIILWYSPESLLYPRCLIFAQGTVTVVIGNEWVIGSEAPSLARIRIPRITLPRR